MAEHPHFGKARSAGVTVVKATVTVTPERIRHGPPTEIQDRRIPLITRTFVSFLALNWNGISFA